MLSQDRVIAWPSVITVISAAILIGAEVLGGAFASGWALGVLLELNETATHILQGVLFVVGLFVIYGFLRKAQRIEPFTRRS